MAKLTRRNTVIGLLALAGGGGATITSAAFQDSVSPEADLRVVVDENLEVRKGVGFDTGDSKYTDDDDFFSGNDIDDEGAFNGEDPPLAFVNDEVNDELVINTAVNLESTVTFDEILEISNQTSAPVEVGIAYDRDAEQYGSDVGDGGDLISFETAQQVYQFEANDGDDEVLISPDPGEDGVEGENDTIEEDEDKPAASVEIASGETLQIDLVVDTDTTDDDIESAVNENTGTFGETRSTVDILDEITVGTFDFD